MKGVNAEKHTVLLLSDAIQNDTGMPEVGNSKNVCQPFTAFKKIIARCETGEQNWVFLHPQRHA